MLPVVHTCVQMLYNIFLSMFSVGNEVSHSIKICLQQNLLSALNMLAEFVFTNREKWRL